MEKKLVTYDVPNIVNVRKYKIDCNLLCQCLREHKEKANYSNKEIAEKLNIPVTKVEHWFRNDNSFAIPDINIWANLKELLNIETNEFDMAIMTFEEKEGVFEKSNRIYDAEGIAPTIMSGETEIKILTNESKHDNPEVFTKNTIRLGEMGNGGQGQRVYDPSGCSVTMSAQGGGQGAKTGLYLTNEKTVRVKRATKQGYIDCKIGGVADLSYPYSKTRRGRVQDNGDTSPTITATETGVCVIEDASKVYYRIRKLTPIECGRLMDVSDEDIAKIKAIGISDSQMYKLFGNSIVVGVMCHLFSQML